MNRTPSADGLIPPDTPPSVDGRARPGRAHFPHADGSGAFDSDEVKVLTDAFDQAWKVVEESGACFASGTYKNATREILALRIIEIAQLGERDPNRLRDDALLYLAKSTGM
jgi:hypothetical protein